MLDISNVEDVKAMIAVYQSYSRIFAFMTIVMLILLSLMWKRLAIPYAFASVTGIAARSAIRKYRIGPAIEHENRLSKMQTTAKAECGGIEKKDDTRTKYKNFIMIQEVMSAAELPKELKVL